MFAPSIAKRFLSANKKQTLGIIMGIAIGVAVQIFVGSLIGGLQQTLLNSAVGNSPHITITSTTNNSRIVNYSNAVSTIKGIDGVKTVITVEDAQGFVQNFSRDQLVLMRGFDIEAANSIYGYLGSKLNGSAPAKLGDVMVGKDSAKEHNFRLSDKLRIQRSLSNPNSTYDVTITGIYDLGVSSINSLWIITNYETTNAIFSFGANITSIEIQVSSPLNAKDIQAKISNAITLPNTTISNWEDQNSQLLSGFQAQSISTYMIQAFVLVSVVIGISSVLAITVVQKSRQLGILKAMGTNDKQTATMFVTEGALFGALGVSLGVILGLFMFWGFATNVTDSNGAPLIGFYLDPTLISITAIISVVACIVAALIPAIRASRLSVIEVIRNG